MPFKHIHSFRDWPNQALNSCTKEVQVQAKDKLLKVFLCFLLLYIFWQVLKAPSLFPWTYISRSSKIDRQRGANTFENMFEKF